MTLPSEELGIRTLPGERAARPKKQPGKGLSGLFKDSSLRGRVYGEAETDYLTSDSPAVPHIIRPGSQSSTSLGPTVKGRNIDRKHSVPSRLATPPNLVDAPSTVVTPPTPPPLIEPFTPADILQSRQTVPKDDVVSTVRRNENLQNRRRQSASIPTKISNIFYAPLTPPAEEPDTTEGNPTLPSSGFFSSVLSVAQKAAGQITAGASTSILQYSKASPTPPVSSGSDRGVEVILDSATESGEKDLRQGNQLPAITTLGQGDLRLSHLGITDDRESNQMNSTNSVASVADTSQKSDTWKISEQDTSSRPPPSIHERPTSTLLSEGTARPTSVASNDRVAFNGDQTPPRAIPDDLNGIKRSGSTKSRLSGRGRRKHRASSATAGTSNSVAAAIKESAAGLANPSVNGQGHRLTGFAVASSKRNRDFHQLFRSVPEDDYLIEDYSAALQRDILLHGRLYVSEGHICFSSNILGWVTNLVVSFDEVVSVEKKSTAVIFPNAIVISTLHARNTFASFVARDSTYELLIGIWKISHPNLKSSLNGVMLDDSSTGDKTEVANPEDSEGESDDGSEDEVYDEDAEDDGHSLAETGFGSAAPSEVGDLPASRKVSANPTPFPPFANGSMSKGINNPDLMPPAGPVPEGDFPGSAVHGPTECSDGSDHYEKPLVDVVIPAPLGKVYSLLFGPASGVFMRKWLLEEQKVREVNYVGEKTGLDADHRSASHNYIRPLNGPVGPKQTKCITNYSLTTFDLDKAVSVDCSTQTPDVPNGNIFTVKTRYCLMWGAGNSTRMVANCTVEWTGKSWLKGMFFP